MIMMAMMVADDGRLTVRLIVNAEKNTTYTIGKLMEYIQLVKYYALVNIMLCLILCFAYFSELSLGCWTSRGANSLK